MSWLRLVPCVLLACGSDASRTAATTSPDASSRSRTEPGPRATEAATDGGSSPDAGWTRVNRWDAGPNLPAPRSHGAAATDANGRIHVFGGSMLQSNTDVETAVLERNASAWIDGPLMTMDHESLSGTAALDGRLFAFGGYMMKYAESYDPKANAWAAIEAMPFERDATAAVCVPDGRIFVIGGRRIAPNGPNAGTVGDVDAYDPKTNSWTSRAPLPTPRHGLTATVGLDGRIYAIGGQHDMSGSVGVTEAYEPASDKWTTVSPMPTARLMLVSGRGGDGRIYAIGGLEDLESGTPPYRVTSAVEAYDPSTDTWSRAAPMPMPRHSAAATTRDGKLFVAGGIDEANVMRAEVQIYSP